MSLFTRKRVEKEPDIEAPPRDPSILVLGLGGGGCNTINRLSHMSPRTRTIAVNTDKKSLTRTQAEQRLLIGSSYVDGKGTEGNIRIGRDAAANAKVPLGKMVKGSDITFLICGLGGGTGTGGAPVVADHARKNDSHVISIVTLPFSMEKKRRRIALKGVKELRKNSDLTILLDNDKLLGSVPTLKARLALSVIDQLVCEVVLGMINSLERGSMMPLDIALLKELSDKGSLATIMWGESTDPYRAVDEALNNPLLDVDMKRIDRMVCNIVGGRGLSTANVNMMFQSFIGNLDPKMDTFCTAYVEPERRGYRIIALATGKDFDIRY